MPNSDWYLYIYVCSFLLCLCVYIFRSIDDSTVLSPFSSRYPCETPVYLLIPWIFGMRACVYVVLFRFTQFWWFSVCFFVSFDHGFLLNNQESEYESFAHLKWVSLVLRVRESARLCKPHWWIGRQYIKELLVRPKYCSSISVSFIRVTIAHRCRISGGKFTVVAF